MPIGELDLRQEGHQRREHDDIASEGVKKTDGGVAVAAEEEEPVDGVEDDMVVEEREVEGDEGAGREVEEADGSVEVWVAGVQAVAFRKHHPLPWVEAWPDGACGKAANKGWIFRQ